LVLIKVIFRITTVSVFLSYLDSHNHVQQHGLATDFILFASQVSSIGNTVFLHFVSVGVGWRETQQEPLSQTLIVYAQKGNY
jgi:hypothetical protein